MTKLHEVLAAEKTRNTAWNDLYGETLKKLSNLPFFNGQIKSLKMIEENAGNEALEAAESKTEPVRTNAHDTMEYALGIFIEAEKLQLQKNQTNAIARGTVEFRGRPLIGDVPVDQLLGLEARLAKIRTLYIELPTLDASREWAWQANEGVWVSPAEHVVKTEKIMVPVVLSPATDKHPAQVEKVTRDKTVGKFTTTRRSGAATAVQKSEAIKMIDELLVEVKKARMRANEAEVVFDGASALDELFAVLMAPLKSN